YVEVGRRSKGCTGFGVCSITIGLDFSTERTVPSSASIKNGIMDLDFLGLTPDRGDVLTIDEDVVLDGAASRAFGYQQITIRKGEYKFDYSKSPNGHVVLPVNTLGIVITINVGRRSKDCTGFGICSIVIGASATDRAVPGVGTVHDN